MILANITQFDRLRKHELRHIRNTSRVAILDIDKPLRQITRYSSTINNRTHRKPNAR